MTKTGKRILSIVLLGLTVLLIGYLVFTGNRLADFPKGMEDYEKDVFIGEDGIMVAFNGSGALYTFNDETVIILTFSGYSDGVITMCENGKDYRFVAIGESILYDENTKQFLKRRGAYG